MRTNRSARRRSVCFDPSPPAPGQAVSAPKHPTTVTAATRRRAAFRTCRSSAPTTRRHCSERSTTRSASPPPSSPAPSERISPALCHADGPSERGPVPSGALGCVGHGTFSAIRKEGHGRGRDVPPPAIGAEMRVRLRRQRPSPLARRQWRLPLAWRCARGPARRRGTTVGQGLRFRRHRRACGRRRTREKTSGRLRLRASPRADRSLPPPSGGRARPAGSSRTRASCRRRARAGGPCRP